MPQVRRGGVRVIDDLWRCADASVSGLLAYGDSPAAGAAEEDRDLDQMAYRNMAKTLDPVMGLIHVAEQAGCTPNDALGAVLEFLFSDIAFDAPANDISALMMAALARKAASGQRRPPSPGMWNDITAIASFLPYCDAMFLDNECAGLLREEPLRTKLAPFGTRIFSGKTGDEFLAYLAGLEEQAGPEHVRLVADVYGDDWSVPYREILVHERERQGRTG